MAKAKIDEYNSMFGDDVIKPAEKSSKVAYWYDTGNYALNYICSKNLLGGIASGRVTGFEGLNSTGKSLIAVSVLRDPKLDLGIIIDTEGGGNSQELMEFAGVDLTKIRILKAHTLGSYRISKKNGKREEVADKDVPAKLETADYIYVRGAILMVKNLLNSFTLTPALREKKVAIILDSVANLQSVRELNGGYDMGKRSQEIGAFFRTFDNEIEKTNVALIYTNKLYKNFENPYDPWVPAGGENVYYNSSLVLRLSTTVESDDITEKDKKDDKENKNTSLGTTYSTLKAFVRKSRFGTRHRASQFMIDSQFGITKYSGMFKLLRDFDVIQGSGTWYSCPELWEDKRFYKKDFINLLKENPDENIAKIQKILENKELQIKKQREDDINSGKIDAEHSEDFVEETNDFSDLVADSEDMIKAVVREEGL